MKKNNFRKINIPVLIIILAIIMAFSIIAICVKTSTYLKNEKMQTATISIGSGTFISEADHNSEVSTYKNYIISSYSLPNSNTIDNDRYVNVGTGHTLWKDLFVCLGACAAKDSGYTSFTFSYNSTNGNLYVHANGNVCNGSNGTAYVINYK